jgi:phosphate transport system substrate-binding protein
MGAEFTPPQLADYRAKAGADPVAFRVAHASLDPRALSGPLAIFVHRDNPLASISLEDATRIYAGDARTWGELGLQGDWAKRPLNAYGVERGTPLALSFRANALRGKPFGKGMVGFPQSRDVVKKVAEDPSGIGYAAAMRELPDVRALPISPRAGEGAVALTRENIQAGRYPLDRFLLIYVRPPVAPVVREFLRLVLSSEGQAAIAAAPQAYIPLSAAEVAVELERLGQY